MNSSGNHSIDYREIPLLKGICKLIMEYTGND